MLLTRNQALVLFGGVAAILLGKCSSDVVENMLAIQGAANQAASRINISCNPDDVSRTPVPYEFQGPTQKHAREVSVSVIGQDLDKSPVHPGVIANMKAIDSFQNKAFYFPYKTRCPYLVIRKQP